VGASTAHSFTKQTRPVIRLVEGLGVEGDAHAGTTVQHLSRVRRNPNDPNLRQVHLIHAELFEELRARGYGVEPGQLGENLTTRGIDLLGLPRGTVLRFLPRAGRGGEELAASRPGVDDAAGRTAREAVEGVLVAAEGASLNAATANAVRALGAAADRAEPGGTAVALMGLRNPCGQINTFRSGLLKEVIGHDPEDNVVRKGGVMAVVLYGGVVRPGDEVRVELPPGPHEPLECV
jgi:hypothetical protein